jgi:hypothetical protein
VARDGPVVAAMAAEFGAESDKIIVVGHSMGAGTQRDR